MIYIGFTIFLISFIFGIAVKKNLFNTAKFHFMHHVFFFLVILSAVLTALQMRFDGNHGAWFMILMVFLLLGMRFFLGRTPQHWKYATFCLIVYTALLIFL
jgi:hypothetical protein